MIVTDPLSASECPRLGGAPQNPFVFVVGSPRSGTTLLMRMLDAHPRLGVVDDSPLITSAVVGAPAGRDPEMTPGILEAMVSDPRCSRLGLALGAAWRAGEAASFAEFATTVYEAAAAQRGKELAGERSPASCRHLPRIHSLFPGAKIVHLLRDGRDVALSLRHCWKGAARPELAAREPIAAAALSWKRDITHACTDGLELGPTRYLEVRYENLVTEPSVTLKAIAGFLGLPFAPEMLEYFRGKASDRADPPARAAWLPPTPGLRDWRTQMTVRECELFEALAGAELEWLGYERRFANISGKTASSARECEERWAAGWDERTALARR